MKKRLLSILIASMLTCTFFVGCTKDSEGDTNTGSEVTTDAGNSEDKTEEVYDAVVEAYGENYLPSSKLDEENIESRFGLTSDMYTDCIAEIPMMSAQVDTFVVVKAAEGKETDVVNALNSYRDGLLNDSMQYPMNILKIEASRVIQVNGYVFFIMLGSTDDTLENDDEILTYFEEQNDIAVEAINKVLD